MRKILLVLAVVVLLVAGIAGCAEEKVTPTPGVTPTNISPVANTDWATTTVGTAVVIDVTANDTDADGTVDVTTVTIVDNPDDGTASADATTGDVTYTPSAEFSGTDSFTYRVKDDDGVNSNVATVIVTIPTPGNVDPVAVDDAATIQEDTAAVIDVTANDTDADGTIDVTTVGVVVGPDHGTVTVSSTTGDATYTPASGFFGTDTFTYRVADNGVYRRAGEHAEAFLAEGRVGGSHGRLHG